MVWGGLGCFGVVWGISTDRNLINLSGSGHGTILYNIYFALTHIL